MEAGTVRRQERHARLGVRSLICLFSVETDSQELDRSRPEQICGVGIVGIRATWFDEPASRVGTDVGRHLMFGIADGLLDRMLGLRRFVIVSFRVME